MGNNATSEGKPVASAATKHFKAQTGLRRKKKKSDSPTILPEAPVPNKINAPPLSATPAPEKIPQTSRSPPNIKWEINSEANTLQSELENILRARRQRIDAAQPDDASVLQNSSQPGRLPGLSPKTENYYINVTTGKTAAAAAALPTEPEEKCYDPNDPTLEFVDGEDDMDIMFMEYKSLRARMSCGHTVTPMSLTDYCRHLLDEGQFRFVCAVPGCNVEWPYDEIYKMALLTPEEIEYYEKALYKIAKSNFLDIKTCPGCKCSVVRADVNDLRVLCPECTVQKNRVYEFCWQCLKEWTRPSPHTNRCADPECVNKQQEMLLTCKAITFLDVKGVTGCPSIRACPTCGMLIEHSKQQCKNIVCPRCTVEFCFVCLRLTSVCGTYYQPCSVGIAPRQTTIPVWKVK